MGGSLSLLSHEHGEYKGTVKNERSSPGRRGEGPMKIETEMTSAKVGGLPNNLNYLAKLSFIFLHAVCFI